MDEFKTNDGVENTNNDEINRSDDTEINDTEKSLTETEEIVEVSAKSGMKKELLDWAVSIAVALALALFIRHFIFTLVRVDGPSMQPTLHHNDTLYVNRFMYTPEVGDVIIFKPRNSPSTPYVKRVIATEGQEVVIDEQKGEVYVDGKLLDEDYISEPLVSGGTIEYPYVVPEDCVFVLGDNRNNSLDSRVASVGAVSRDSIIGHVIFRILPISDFGKIN